MEKSPLGVLFICGVCTSLYVLDWIFEFDIGALSIQAYSVIYSHQLYRLITSSYLHGGLWHILMNMVSVFSFGMSVELMFGTFQFLYIIGLYTILTNCLYVGICYGMSLFFGRAWLYGSAIGFSGVLFALAVQESFLAQQATRKVFGLITVPTRIYPWVLLVVLQFFLPNISFLGHLCGIFAGLLHVYRVLALFIPSNEKFRALEGLGGAASLVGSPRFCACPLEPVRIADGGGFTGLLKELWRFALVVLTPLWACFASLLNCLFGGVGPVPTVQQRSPRADVELGNTNTATIVDIPRSLVVPPPAPVTGEKPVSRLVAEHESKQRKGWKPSRKPQLKQKPERKAAEDERLPLLSEDTAIDEEQLIAEALKLSMSVEGSNTRR